MTDIVKYEGNAQQLPATLDKAEQAIALASNPQEINSVLAMMDAAVAYANRFYKDQRDLIQRAKALQARAERRLGELLRDMPKATGVRMAGRDSVGGTVLVPPKNEPTLAEIGIDKKTSARAQKLAALPDDVFAQVESGAVSVAKAIASKEETPKPKKSRALDARPDDVPEASNADELADAARVINELAEENTKLMDQIAIGQMEGSDIAKADAMDIIEDLREQVKTLEAELDAVKVMRDQYMQESAEKTKQVNYWRRQADKKVAA